MHARLGRRIVGLAKLAALTVDGGDVDDTSEAALQHAIPERTGDIEDRIQVDVDDRLPLRQLHALEGLVTGDPGAVHQHIHGTGLLHHLGDHALGIVPGRNVTNGDRDIQTFRLAGSQPGFGLFLFRRMVVGHHPHSVFSQPLADGGTDTADTAGHQSYTHWLRHFRELPN